MSDRVQGSEDGVAADPKRMEEFRRIVSSYRAPSRKAIKDAIRILQVLEGAAGEDAKTALRIAEALVEQRVRNAAAAPAESTRGLEESGQTANDSDSSTEEEYVGPSFSQMLQALKQANVHLAESARISRELQLDRPRVSEQPYLQPGQQSLHRETLQES